MLKRNALKTIAISALSIGAAGLFSACSEKKKAEFRGVDITGADYARDLPLTVTNEYQRPMLQSYVDGPAYLQSTLSKSHLREMRRQWRAANALPESLVQRQKMAASRCEHLASCK